MLSEIKEFIGQNGTETYSEDIARDEIRRINALLADYHLCVNNIALSYTLVTYIVNLKINTKINSLLKLERNFAIALRDNNCRLYLEGDKLCIEKKGANNTIRFGNLLYLFNDFVGQTDGLKITLGVDNRNKVQICDLAKAPHMLVAGYTGSGKSVFLRNIILSLLVNHDNDVDFIGIDPKGTEFEIFGRHMRQFKFIKETSVAINELNNLVTEMENRYRILNNSHVRDIDEYNSKVGKMKRIVCVIDEFADLMLTGGRSVETAVVRLAQKARAAGIHLVIGTQRPTADVITGLIKANIPCRIALSVKSALDSRIIIDQKGAEMLNGKGDMLYQSPNEVNPIRIQGCYVDEDEIKCAIYLMLKNNHPELLKDTIVEIRN